MPQIGENRLTAINPRSTGFFIASRPLNDAISRQIRFNFTLTPIDREGRDVFITRDGSTMDGGCYSGWTGNRSFVGAVSPGDGLEIVPGPDL